MSKQNNEIFEDYNESNLVPVTADRNQGSYLNKNLDIETRKLVGIDEYLKRIPKEFK